MHSQDLHSRLSRITTFWSVLARAHDGTPDAARTAQQLLMERYGSAIYRYLLSAVRDPSEADELRQEFALALVRGEFRKADPNRGRFRDYLKSALFHLVSKHRKKQLKQGVQLAEDAPEVQDVAAPAGEDERAFNETWRDELLARTWDALAQAQRTFFDVLRYRADHPELSSEQMAQALSQPQGKSWTPAAIRQTLRRAREKFADLLLDLVAYSLQFPDVALLEDELSELNLLAYCRPALERYQS